MIYVKFKYKGAWFFYGPWKEVKVQYNRKQFGPDALPKQFNIDNCLFTVDEVFINGNSDDGYTIVSGWDKGVYRSIALDNLSGAYLLTAEGKTLERI